MFNNLNCPSAFEPQSELLQSPAWILKAAEEEQSGDQPVRRSKRLKMSLCCAENLRVRGRARYRDNEREREREGDVWTQEVDQN